MGQRLTSADASFVYAETASGPMHISSVYVLEGELPYERVLKHFEERIHLVPAYRRRLVQVPLNIAHPSWEDDPEFDLRRHVRHHAMPHGTSLQDGFDAAVHLNEPMLDRSRPLWGVWVVSGVPDRTLILQMTHHAMIDGASGIELTTILYDFDAKGGNTPPPEDIPFQPPPLPGPVDTFREALQEQMDPEERAGGLLEGLGDESQRSMVMRAMGVLQRFVTRPAITAPFNAGLVGPTRRARWVKKPFGEIREIRKSLGGTINDVVLTVITEGVARYLAGHGQRAEGQHLRIMCPVNVRTESEEGALGNKVSAIFPNLPAWPMDVGRRLTAVCAEMNRIKDDEEAQALALLTNRDSRVWPVALAPTQVVGTDYDPTRWLARNPLPVMTRLATRLPNWGINFVCTNVPGVQVPQYMCGHQVLDTVGLLVLSGNVGFSLTILSYNKQLFFNFISEPRLMPDLEVLVAHCDDAFKELLDAARAHAAQLTA